MAATKYAQHVQHNARREGVMSRHEYCQRARELAPRGQELPQAKLLELDVVDIRSAHRQRTALLKHIKDNLSNAALARRYNISERAIEKIVGYISWSHVA